MLHYPAPNPVIVPIADRLPGKVKQKAHWDNALSITPQADGSLQVQLLLTVRLYEATAEGDYGLELSTKGFSSRQLTLRTDNLTAVQPSGRLRYLRETDTTARDLVSGELVTLPVVEGDNYLAWLEALPEKLLLQNFLFQLICDTQDVRIRHLIEQNITQADAMGRFA